MRILIVLMLLATCAGAAPVDLDSPSGLASIIAESNGNGFHGLCADGTVHRWIGADQSWEQAEGFTVPVSVETIRDWQLHALITHDGDYWVRDMSGSGWTHIPASPCGDVASEESSIGDVKSMFR